jgi:phage/plasmid-like protein (TIGR03299 family)
MSHDLEIINGEAQAMYERVAWHALGTVVGANFGWDDAIAAGLTITLPVTKVPLGSLLSTLPVGDGFEGPTLHAQPDEYASVRSDGLVLKAGTGEQHTIFPAVDGYAFGQCVREEAQSIDGVRADLKSLGTIDLGRKWFMTFDLGEFHIGDYAVRDYISVNGSYDSSWPLQLLSSPVIEVCANTIAAARAAGVQHYRFKHTSGVFNRVEQAKIALARHAENRKLMKELGETLLTRAVLPSEYNRIVNTLFPIGDDTQTKTRNVNEDAIEKVSTLYKAQVGPQVVSASGNAWALVQAVNTYENWGTPVRNTKGNTESQTRALRQIEAVNSGRQPLTDKAFELVGALN